MKRRVVRTTNATRDLEEAYVYIGLGSVGAAERFIEAAERTFELLVRMPRIGRPWHSSVKGLTGVRLLAIPKFRNYVVFYRPIRGGVEILHVIHSARDIESLLRDEQ